MGKISAIVNTLNEEKNIGDCLECLKWCDEIVVVDMYSDDKTVEIASEYTNKVLYYKRVGYVEPARQFAVEQAVGDWIFIVDADERVPKALAEKLRKIAEENLPNKDIISIPRKNYALGKWIKHAAWYPDSQLRFFRKGAMRFGDRIHHSCQPQGKIYRLNKNNEDEVIIHFSYYDTNDLIKRMLRYTDVEAKHLFDKGKKSSFFSIIYHGIRRFWHYYLFKGGFREGLRGFIVCLNAGLYRTITYIKLWEMYQRNFIEEYARVNKEIKKGYDRED